MEKSFSALPDRLAQVEYNYRTITENIARAAQQTGRDPQDIELVCVTKTVGIELINHVIRLGASHIGENRVQELDSKFDLLENRDDLKISVIGHLQTNKVKKAVELSHMIQSVDSLHLAQEISRRSVDQDKTIECLVEVNIGAEESKSGTTPEQVEELIDQMSVLQGIKVLGLMAIPPAEAEISETRRYFEKMRKLFIDIKTKKHDNSNIVMKYLSMGMSADYADAIMEGSNMVRVGSALFGARKY